MKILSLFFMVAATLLTVKAQADEVKRFYTGTKGITCQGSDISIVFKTIDNTYEVTFNGKKMQEDNGTLSSSSLGDSTGARTKVRFSDPDSGDYYVLFVTTTEAYFNNPTKEITYGAYLYKSGSMRYIDLECRGEMWTGE